MRPALDPDLSRDRQGADPTVHSGATGPHAAVDGRVRARRALAAFLLVAAGGSYLLHGPGLLAWTFDGEQYRSTGRAQRIHEILRSIPAGAGVATQTHLVPHLANRRHLYLLPWVRDWAAVDYVLLDRRGNRYPLGDDEYERLEGELTPRLGFERALEMEDLALYRRNPG